MRDTLSTNGEHLWVAEVKSFPAIPKSMRSVHEDRNGANLKKWSALLVCTIPHGREEQTECGQNSETEDEDRMRAALRKREREKKRGQSDQAWPNKKDNQMLPI